MKKYKTLKDFADTHNMVLFNHVGTMPEVQNEYYASVSEDDEVMQWYALESESDEQMAYYNETYKLNIFYSDTLGIWILPVYSYGMGWEYVTLK